MFMEMIHYDDVGRMQSSVRWDEAEDQNLIWDTVNELNLVFVETKGQCEWIKSSVHWDEAEDQNLI